MFNPNEIKCLRFVTVSLENEKNYCAVRALCANPFPINNLIVAL